MSHTPSAAGQSQTLSPRLILQTQSGRTQRSDAGLYSDLDRKVVNVRSTCFRLMPDICISLPIADQGDSRTRSQGSLMYAEGSDTGRTSKERILNAILSVTGNLSCSVSSIFLYMRICLQYSVRHHSGSTVEDGVEQAQGNLPGLQG